MDLTGILLNDGAIPVQAVGGVFSVDPIYSLSGIIEFWNSGVVSDTLITLEGGTTYFGQSSLNGAYQVSGVEAGDYLLTAEKTDEINGISAYDASLALQHAAGLITLSGSASAAADVDNSGTIGTTDALYILDKSVGLIDVPFPGSASACVARRVKLRALSMGSILNSAGYFPQLMECAGMYHPSAAITTASSPASRDRVARCTST